MSDFGKWLLENDIVEEASIRISDCKAAYEAGRKAGLEAAAEIVGGGCFYHENAPDAIFARAASAAIRERVRRKL